ncbi:toxin-antitoxin system TumE family protein [Rhizobium halophytocola]|uniref:Uncharacterized protein n=1 Tax=Rhizobium halophytocola TaxID=735519 RepID=A0ABS4DWU7_9HYPH|nr:DUF6516 family protein [Rhizobium halophytocola]MBP1850168.1 hypothetical protein [Rhizobium halophytocola]
MAKAILVQRTRNVLRDDVFAEILIWRVPVPLRGSTHGFKYSLALVAGGICVLRYDNEAGKGDHRHRGPQETAYAFSGMDSLLEDFGRDVRQWLDDNPEG